MKKIFLLLAVVAGMALTQSCEGDQGPKGDPGTNIEAEVFELRNVDFVFDQGEYKISQQLTPAILDSDVILIYRLAGTINPTTPIWEPIPRTLYLGPTQELELDYDFDFSPVDFTIYAGGNYDLSTTPNYLNDQTFRIVIVPGYFSNKVNTKNFEEVTAALKLTDEDFTKSKK